MALGDRCIIEVALNGMTVKEVNPNVPRTPEEIAQDALRCVRAGASIVHNHNDENLWEPPSRVHAAQPYIEAWTPLLAAHPDVLTYPTMASGGPGVAFKDRWGHHDQLVEADVLRMGLVDPGSLSVGLLGQDGLPMELDLLYVNTFADSRQMLEGCRRLKLAPSISIFDPSFLRVALAFHHAGALPSGAIIKLYFGGDDAVPFGLPPTASSLNAYLGMLDGTGLPWLVAVLGGDVLQSGLVQHALERGGHLRVGLEDYKGPRTPTNLQLVEELAEVVTRSGRQVATPQDTLDILNVPDGAEADGGRPGMAPAMSDRATETLP